jgi:(1->4)-alpha-D-glucan 1-alpha-D-glucosylmutase
VVFEEAHRMPLRLMAEGKVTGFRVDHPDGLAYPTRYFRLLQDAHILDRAADLCRRRGLNWDEIGPEVRQELEREVRARGVASPFFKPVYVVAEKILGGTERLPQSWAVRGTTGYDFLNQVNGLFVDPRARDMMDRIYSRYIGGHIDFEELVYQKKKLILYTALASEMNLLARQLNRISEGNRWTRDFTLYSLRAALIEVVACFPVYRTYVGEDSGVDERDRRYILQAVACAKRRNPTENASIYDFIADILLQKFAEYVAEPERPVQLAFVIKMQQVLGPVMAKGLEDTTFYVYNRLVSLNEVGGEPNRFGVTPEQFHAFNALRAKSWPRTLLGTSTHDTKRGEDVRTRIDALSEMPRDWGAALTGWTRRVDSLTRDVDGRKAPDRNELTLLFQTLVGMWPNGYDGLPPPQVLNQLSERLQQYMFKAVKEAKVNTSWINEDKSWEEAVKGFVKDLLSLPEKHAFWKKFLPFARRCAQIGLHNSLAQLAAKIASPGVPDIYQGCEMWDLSLVDPDNRRPVDYDLRRRYLRELAEDRRPRPQLARELYERWADGRIKLLVTQAGLRARRERGDLFTVGAYLPIEVRGTRAENVVAFARSHGGATAICIVPRLVSGLLDERGLLRTSELAETTVPVPEVRDGTVLVDAITGEQRAVRAGAIAVSDAFATLPISLLVSRGS